MTRPKRTWWGAGHLLVRKERGPPCHWTPSLGDTALPPLLAPLFPAISHSGFSPVDIAEQR